MFNIQDPQRLFSFSDVYNSAILGDFGITVEAVEALGFLIGASTDRGGWGFIGVKNKKAVVNFWNNTYWNNT